MLDLAGYLWLAAGGRFEALREDRHCCAYKALSDRPLSLELLFLVTQLVSRSTSLTQSINSSL